MKVNGRENINNVIMLKAPKGHNELFVKQNQSNQMKEQVMSYVKLYIFYC